MEERGRARRVARVVSIPLSLSVFHPKQKTKKQIYPDIVPFARVRIIELSDHLLSTYDREISKYTASQFKRAGIETVLNTRVKAVRGEGRGKGAVVVEDANGGVSEIPFSACVWATGIARHPLVTQLQARLPPGSQTHFRSVVTTPTLEVVGSGGTIFALGDAATIGTGTALAAAADLFEQADANGDGFLDLAELRSLLRTASARFPHFEEHAKFLDDKYGGPARWGGLVRRALAAARTAREVEASMDKAPSSAAATPPADGTVTIDDLDDDTRLTRSEFEALLGSIDRGIRALPATAQVAAQQGKYLARLAESGALTAAVSSSSPSSSPSSPPPPFRYGHKGSLAYVGQDRAVMDLPVGPPIVGWAAGAAWRSYETISQISVRNIFLVAGDWVRTKLFGRDISRF
jgi:NADH:ubiquinone reductase (non-electrogenic)